MSSLAYRITTAALLGAALFAGPLAPAFAQAPTTQAPARTAAASTATSSQPETVEQRIASLHRELKITPDEETGWNAVAQAMRDNAAAMQKLIEAKYADNAQPMTALDDLDSYSKFAQAHADGVKNLTASFTTLYNSMPDAQKKIADQVFSGSRHPSNQAQG